MILILSIHNDQDTQLVIDWLKFKKAAFFRLNDDDLITGKTEFFYEIGKPDKAYVRKQNTKIYLKDVKVVWFRKFGFLSAFKKDEIDLRKYIKLEFLTLCKVLYKLLADKKWLFRHETIPNKIQTLEKAVEVGLKIPKSLILTSRAVLENLNKKTSAGLISKALKEGEHLVDKKKNHYSLFTTQIDKLNKVPEFFGPSFVQGYVDKEYELRCFYLDGKFWSMAIFSQNNEKTKIDFRNYDRELPNRTVPYKLPRVIENKLVKLMTDLDLNTGSIDLIKPKGNEYIFLEVNPSGQFGMTAFPCNYPLHKEVSEYLIKESTNYD